MRNGSHNTALKAMLAAMFVVGVLFVVSLKLSGLRRIAPLIADRAGAGDPQSAANADFAPDDRPLDPVDSVGSVGSVDSVGSVGSAVEPGSGVAGLSGSPSARRVAGPLTAESAAVSDRLARIEKQISELADNLPAREDTREITQAVHESLSSTQRTVQSLGDRLEQGINGIRVSNEVELRDLNRQISGLSTVHRDLRTEVDRQSSGLTGMRDQIQTSQKDVASRVEGLITDLKTLRTELSPLQTLPEQIASLKSLTPGGTAPTRLAAEPKPDGVSRLVPLPSTRDIRNSVPVPASIPSSRLPASLSPEALIAALKSQAESEPATNSDPDGSGDPVGNSLGSEPSRVAQRWVPDEPQLPETPSSQPEEVLAAKLAPVPRDATRWTTTVTATGDGASVSSSGPDAVVESGVPGSAIPDALLENPSSTSRTAGAIESGDTEIIRRQSGTVPADPPTGTPQNLIGTPRKSRAGSLALPDPLEQTSFTKQSASRTPGIVLPGPEHQSAHRGSKPAHLGVAAESDLPPAPPAEFARPEIIDIDVFSPAAALATPRPLFPAAPPKTGSKPAVVLPGPVVPLPKPQLKAAPAHLIENTPATVPELFEPSGPIGALSTAIPIPAPISTPIPTPIPIPAPVIQTAAIQVPAFPTAAGLSQSTVRRFEIRVTALHLDGVDTTALEQAGVHSSNLLLTGTTHQAVVGQTLDRTGSRSSAHRVHTEAQTCAAGESVAFPIGYLCQHCNEVDGVGGSDQLQLTAGNVSAGSVTFTVSGQSPDRNRSVASLATMTLSVAAADLASGFTTLISEVPQEGTLGESAKKGNLLSRVIPSGADDDAAAQYVQRVAVVTIRELPRGTGTALTQIPARMPGAQLAGNTALPRLLPAPPAVSDSSRPLGTRSGSQSVVPVKFEVFADAPRLIPDSSAATPIPVPGSASSIPVPGSASETRVQPGANRGAAFSSAASASAASASAASASAAPPSAGPEANAAQPRFPASLHSNPETPQTQAVERQALSQQFIGLFQRNRKPAANTENTSVASDTGNDSAESNDSNESGSEKDKQSRHRASFGAASRR